jgi:hypothetical protein
MLTSGLFALHNDPSARSYVRAKCFLLVSEFEQFITRVFLVAASPHRIISPHLRIAVSPFHVAQSQELHALRQRDFVV